MRRSSGGSRRAPGAVRRGGRPSREEAAALEERILDVATRLFLAHGFGATTIEAVAEEARIAKRTFYHRYTDKADLFRAVIRRLIDRWLIQAEPGAVEPGSLGEALLGSARRALAVALSPEALALHRIVLAEAQRFPELARAINDSGARRGIERMALLFEAETRAGRLQVSDGLFAAEQFLTMVLAVPQRRALGLGPPMSGEDVERWARRSIELFLDGARAGRAGNGL